MLLKYFYQVGLQFQFDKKNGMVIPDIKRTHFSHGDIISLLELDKVEVNHLESLKYWNKTHEGWVEISEKTHLDLRDETLLLLLKMREDLPSLNSDLQVKFNNLIKSMSYQESRIKDLETRLKHGNVPMLSLQSAASISFGDLDLARHTSSNLIISSTTASDDSRLDISFLYANPLVKESKDKPIPLNEPIDFESEINCLVQIFQDSNKKISARFEVANLDNISEIIRKKPKILHISCHGAYEEVDGDSKFYLHFEDNKGRLDKFDLEKLNNLLKSSVEEKSQIEIVFVSACHSEAVANVFREAKVPAVICVHSATKVLDEAAQKFAKIFYDALLDGKSLAYSFEQAKRVVSAGIDQNSRVPHCCCSHTHKSGCRWHEKSIKDYEDAHQYHLKQCKCSFKESHMHMRNCPWAVNLLSDENFESIGVGTNYIKICCCSPEAAHDESNKFLLKSDPEFIKESPFSSLPPGNLEVKNKNCLLNINFSVEMKTTLIGRNVELYNALSIFSSQNLNKNRLVTVFGSEGSGKHSFAKLAGKYMFERKFFPDGVIYINTRGHVMSDEWFISKVISTLDLDSPIDDINQFCNLIRQLRVLIIVNFSRQHEETLKEIHKMMKIILDETKTPKFLICLEKPLDLDLYENKLLLKPLDEYYSAKLLMILAGDHLPKILKNDIMQLAKHEIIKISQGIPGKIRQIAGLLQEHKKLDVLIEKIKKDNMKKQTLSDELVKILLDNMSNKNPSLIYEILYVLSILPQGLLEVEITSIYKSNYKEVIEILDYIASNTIIITKSFNKEIKQTFYILADDLLSSVDSLSIEEAIKMKCYRDLVIYYGTLIRDIVNSIYIDNESATEFSAAQNQGMWLSLSVLYSHSYNPEKIYQPVKRYMFDETNILSIIKVDNRFMKELMSKRDLEFIEKVEQLSICMPTILKINRRMTECVTIYNYYLKICEEYNLFVAQGRLYLFKASLYSHYFNQGAVTHLYTRNFFEGSNSGVIFANLIQAKKLFESNKFEEGDAEASFVKSVIMYEMEVNKNRYSHERISKEAFEEIVKELDRAIKIFRRIQNSASLARASFIAAEYGIINKHYEERVMNHYKEALHIFEKENKKILHIKCLQGISKWYMGIKNYVVSKDFVEQAKLTAEKMKSVKNGNQPNELLLYEINKQINEILDQSRVQSHNVFVFIKAHQLVKMHVNSDLIFSRSKSVERFLSGTNKDIEYTIDPVISHYSTFRDRLYERFNKSKKELIIKFDFLTENNLKDVLSKVGRVLHISSDDYNDQGSLFLEGSDGESYELLPNQLQEILAQHQCVYNLVILAIPQSENLAKIFYEAGIPHVICFKFLDEFIKGSDSLPLISFYNIIHEFTIVMLNCIILEQTVEDAYKYALREFNTQIANVRQHLYEYNMKRESISNVNAVNAVNAVSNANLASVLLLPECNNHQVKLYGKCLNFNLANNEETVLFEGKILDLSKVRARMHNIKKRNHAVIGRKREIYHAIKMIKVFNFLNVYGDCGSGKTMITKEICYFLYMRNYFKEGIFFFDISEVKNVEKIKALFHEADVYAALEGIKKGHGSDSSLERKILVVFDNADKMIKYSDNQFFIFLTSFNKDQSVIHFLICSNKKIENQNVTEQLEIPALSPQEAFYFFLYYVKRSIERNEVDVDQEELLNCGYGNLMDRISNMNDLISISMRVKACKGMPKYLKKLAEMASNKSLKTIEWKDLNLPRKMIKNKEDVKGKLYTVNSFTSNMKNNLIEFKHRQSGERNTIEEALTRNIQKKLNLNMSLPIGKRRLGDNAGNSNTEINYSMFNQVIRNNKDEKEEEEDDLINEDINFNSLDHTFTNNHNNNISSSSRSKINNLSGSINLLTGQGVNGLKLQLNTNNNSNSPRLKNRTQIDQSIGLLTSLSSNQNNFSSVNNTAAPIVNKISFKLSTSELSNNSNSSSNTTNRDVNGRDIRDNINNNSNSNPFSPGKIIASSTSNGNTNMSFNFLTNSNNFVNNTSTNYFGGVNTNNTNNTNFNSLNSSINIEERKSLNSNNNINNMTNMTNMNNLTNSLTNITNLNNQSLTSYNTNSFTNLNSNLSSFTNNNLQIANSNTETKKGHRKKKQSEIIEVEEIFSNDEDEVNSQISFILRPSTVTVEHLEEQSFSEEEEVNEDDEDVDTFIHNQAFSPEFKKQNTTPITYQRQSSIGVRCNNQTFSMDFFNQNEKDNNLNNFLKHSLNMTEIKSESKSSSGSRSSIPHGQPIIIQNFFNNTGAGTVTGTVTGTGTGTVTGTGTGKGFEENSNSREGSNINNMGNVSNVNVSNVNMSINIRSSQSKNSKIEERNPFTGSQIKNNNIGFRSKENKKVNEEPPFTTNKNRNRNKNEKNDKLNSSSSSSEIIEDQLTDLLEQSQLRANTTLSSAQSSNMSMSNMKKKKKKGMKSGKMHDKYKQKSNNKYIPGQRKKTINKDEKQEED